MTRNLIALLGLALLAAGCGKNDTAVDEEVVKVSCPTADENGVVQIQEGLTATILKKGFGRVAVSKDYAGVHTTLWLYDENAEGGKGQEIWSSGGINPLLGKGIARRFSHRSDVFGRGAGTGAEGQVTGTIP